MRKISYLTVCATIMLALSSCTDHELAYVTVDFENVTLKGDTVLKDTSFVSKDLSFQNNFTDYGGGFTSWSGFACSSKKDRTTAGYTNDLSVYSNSAASENKFGVFYYSSYDQVAFCVFTNNNEYVIKELKLNNNTYAYLSMRDGDAYAKKFVAGDWFKVTIYGYGANGIVKDSVEYYLADFRNGKSYICSEWTTVNIAKLRAVNKITFGFSSSDTGDYGMNTPAYVCVDDITYILGEEDDLNQDGNKED